ncbi:small ribosomal subunit protein mS22 isoform X2 [Hydra vulgaris]|uniref:Small ribosomal subunit protein mS22 isoform X2 n=1 Tax=Hydra vulgaris TaxID=6087 RepID=A0ABM4C1Q2_HYDVU
MASSLCSRCSSVVKNIFGSNGFGIKKIIVKNRFYSTDFDVTRDVFKSTAPDHRGEKSTLFERGDVQDILKRLTGFDLNIIFKPQKNTLELPKYKVMTEKEIKVEEEKAIAEGKKRLKMPSVMSKRKPIKTQLSINPELIDMDENGANYLFTDISPSKDRNNRGVLVRENDTGILREGSWDERDRMEFMYWPQEGQHHEMFPMLQDEHLPTVFEQKRHLDVLDLINLQCPPDAPDYIRVHERVYNDIEKHQLYDLLQSTRYYGGMVLFFVKNNKFHSFLNFLLENERIPDAVDLIKLYSIIHNVASNSDGINLLKEYLKDHKLVDSLNLLLKKTAKKEAISA